MYGAVTGGLGEVAHRRHVQRRQGRVSKEAPTGGRRERNGAEELGVVAQPRPPGAVGPGPVEDVLPIAVRLEVERRPGDQHAVALGDEVQGAPAGLFGGAAAGLQGVEEGPGGEGIVGWGEGVPGGGVDLVDAIDKGDEDIIGAEEGGAGHGPL